MKSRAKTQSPRRFRTPLGYILRELANPKRPIGEIVIEALGERQGRQLIRAAVRACLRETKGDGTPRSASPSFRDAPLRNAHSEVVRRAASLYLQILQWARPWGQTFRAQSPGLYFRRIAALLGIGPRQFARYVALLRAAGLLSTRQPPPLANGQQQYQVYEMAEIPREVAVQLQRWRQRADQSPVSDAPPPPRETERSRDLAGAFLSRAPPDTA